MSGELCPEARQSVAYTWGHGDMFNINARSAASAYASGRAGGWGGVHGFLAGVLSSHQHALKGCKKGRHGEKEVHHAPLFPHVHPKGRA